MEDKKVLFITFDKSGYYDGIYRELQGRYTHVDYFNTATFTYKYKNAAQKTYAFFYKLTTGKKLKNYYKCMDFVNKVSGCDYDITIIIRPDVLFDSQLEVLRKISKRFIAYYHDSINNIKRKKDVINFFDTVYSYEKKDVKDYNLTFITNFIYFDPAVVTNQPAEYDSFSVMSNDYRVATLKNVAAFFKQKNRSYEFYVMKDGDLPKEDLITYRNKRMDNAEVITHIEKARILTDIHKYGVQDGLTFRVFEAMGFHKKLITTNKDIVNYDFYNPNNIYVIEDIKNIAIPDSFFETPYVEVPQEIYNKYTVKTWVDTITGS